MDFGKFARERGGYEIKMPPKPDDAPATALEIDAIVALSTNFSRLFDVVAKWLAMVSAEVDLPPDIGMPLIQAWEEQCALNNDEQADFRGRIAKQRAAGGTPQAGSNHLAGGLRAFEGAYPADCNTAALRAAYRSGFIAGLAEGRRWNAPPAAPSGSGKPDVQGEEGPQKREPGRLGRGDESPRRVVRRARKGGGDPQGDGAGPGAV